jgi:hypothetical protein
MYNIDFWGSVAYLQNFFCNITYIRQLALTKHSLEELARKFSQKMQEKILMKFASYCVKNQRILTNRLVFPIRTIQNI